MTIDLLHEEEYEMLRKKMTEDNIFTNSGPLIKKRRDTDYRDSSFKAILTTLSLAALIIAIALIVVITI